jgi:predicted nucleotidyltransferase/antitoxin (DNA-binding transcriptional repressor) of toxin-antitoxin stability system
MTKGETISEEELQRSLLSVLERVQAGIDFSITRQGRVVARLVNPSAADAVQPDVVKEDAAAYTGSADAGDLDGAVTQLISAPAVRRVLALFVREPALAVHQRELARRTHLGLRSVQLALKRLVGMGLLAERRDGNRLYYHAVRSERFEGVRELLAREFGITEVLARHLSCLDEPVMWAFVFGSAARGQDRVDSDSDIDLLVVTDASDDELVAPIADAQRELGRDIDVVSYRRAEFSKKRDEGNHFLRSVMGQPRIDVIGSDDDT